MQAESGSHCPVCISRGQKCVDHTQLHSHRRFEDSDIRNGNHLHGIRILLCA